MAKELLWHTLSKDEVLAALGTDKNGLVSQDVVLRQQTHGENRLLEQNRISFLSVFFEQFRNFMVIVLLVATLISGLLGEFTDAVTILIIVFANALLGFFQQVKAERSLQSLRELTAPVARALRDHTWHEIPAKELVPGDVIGLSAGDRVPADCRLLEVSELHVEESALTGESIPSVKKVAAVNDPSAALGDRVNMLYMGTMTTRGVGEAVVVATGMNTEMGRIANLIQASEDSATPLEDRLTQLGQILVYLSLIITFIVVVAGVIHGHAIYEMFLAGVSLAVAAIPEGLPAIVTIALALGVQRMIKRKAIVRKLPSVETLGCATVICSDKTGTLTKNQMTVKEIFIDSRSLIVEGDGYQPLGRVLAGGIPVKESDPALSLLVRIGVSCNNASLTEEHGQISALGDPTEAALLTLGRKVMNFPPDTRLYELPFDSERKRMSVVVKQEDGLQLWVKGAPDLLLDRSTHVMMNGRIEVMTRAHRDVILKKLVDMADRALRTLGFAYKRVNQPDGEADRIEKDLIFVGLVGITDPPRPEVKQAIAQCYNAGIRTVMITGDHKGTAEAIARDLGILPRDGEVVTGAELDGMTDRMLQDRVNNVYVFARVSPLHKLRIVRALQQNGHVVAMTGDGVNDAPAIKAADIGIAMGKTGTDVAKDASALILADDNFATIVAAIEEGRGIYDNIRKFIRYLLASNVGEIVTMFLAMVAGLPLPLLPIQILWVNLVTDGLPAIALGVDDMEEDTMQRPPRDVREGIFARGLGRKIITRGFLIGFMTLFVFYGALQLKTPLETAQTMAFATLVMAQLIHVFDCRSVYYGIIERGIFGNLWLVFAVLSSLLLLLAVIYIPLLRPIFHTSVLSFLEWGIILVAGAIPTFAVQARRTAKKGIMRSLAVR